MAAGVVASKATGPISATTTLSPPTTDPATVPMMSVASPTAEVEPSIARVTFLA